MNIVKVDEFSSVRFVALVLIIELTPILTLAFIIALCIIIVPSPNLLYLETYDVEAFITGRIYFNSFKVENNFFLRR